MPFPPSFDHAWDITQPPDTQLANLLGQDIRNLKDDVMQRMSLLSGTFANRPTPEQANAVWGGNGFGLLYFATDTSKIYQWSGTAWVDVTTSIIPAPLPVAQANVVNSAASVGTTTLYAVPANGAGMYRLDWYLYTAATGAGAVTFTFGWTDDIQVNSAAYNSFQLSSLHANVNFINTGAWPISFYAAANTNITYSTTYAGPGNYTLRLRLIFDGE